MAERLIDALAAVHHVALRDQRSLRYFPERWRTTSGAAGLPEAEQVVVDTADDKRVIVWDVPPPTDEPDFRYLYGNGGSLR